MRISKCLAAVIQLFATTSFAYHVNFDYSGKTGINCSVSDATAMHYDTEVHSLSCYTNSGYTWSSITVEGNSKSSIVKCFDGGCAVNIVDEVTFKVDVLETSEAINIKQEWGDKEFSASVGEVTFTDESGKTYLLRTTAGSTVYYKALPSKGRFVEKLLVINGDDTTTVKTSSTINTYPITIKDAETIVKTTFDNIIYKIIYDVNESEDMENFYDLYSAARDNTTLSAKIPIHKKHIFTGWNSEKDGSGTTYYPKDVIEHLSYVDGEEVSLYAQWYEVKEPKKVNGCYQISNAQELFGFAYIVNGLDGFEQEAAACGKLTANIAVNKDVLTTKDTVNTTLEKEFLSWVPIGLDEAPFSGNFDGDGHSISELYLKNEKGVASFIMAAGNATIKDLTIEKSYFVGHIASSFIASVSSQSNVTITGSHADNRIIGSDLASGFVAEVQESASLSMKNVSNKSFITTDTSAAGFVTVANTGSTISITKAFNEGDIFHNNKPPSNVSPYPYVVAGIIASAEAKKITLDSSYNKGNITTTNNPGYNSTAYHNATPSFGGLLGDLEIDSLIITNSFNEGNLIYDITLKSRDDYRLSGYTGGLVARTYGFGFTKIFNSHNSGNIKAGKAGGIAGYTNGTINIQTTYNEGDVYGLDNYASGLIEDNEATGIVANCYNIGTTTIYDPFYKKENPGYGFFAITHNSIAIKNSYDASESKLIKEHKLNYSDAGVPTLDNVFYHIYWYPTGQEIQYTRDSYKDGRIFEKLYNYVETDEDGNVIEDGINGKVWGQVIGKDPYPLLNGKGISYAESSSSGTSAASSSSTNSGTSSSEGAAEASSSSGKQSTFAAAAPKKLDLVVNGHNVQVRAVSLGSPIAIMDIQGRVIHASQAASTIVNLPLQHAGTYIITVGKQSKIVSIK